MLHTATGLKGCSRNDPDLNACMLASANAAVSFMSKGKIIARACTYFILFFKKTLRLVKWSEKYLSMNFSKPVSAPFGALLCSFYMPT
jgi:hypothetical protein